VGEPAAQFTNEGRAHLDTARVRIARAASDSELWRLEDPAEAVLGWRVSLPQHLSRQLSPISVTCCPTLCAADSWCPVTSGGTDVHDVTGTGRWLTYAELATLRGIKRVGAVRLVQRHKWRRQAGNDGLARVLVPHDALEPVRRTDARTSALTNAAHTDAGSSSGIGTGTSAGDIAIQLAGQLEQANARADEANKRADVAVALADRTLARLTEVEQRADAEWLRAERAEQALAAERHRADKSEVALDRLETELDAEKAAKATAEADATELRRRAPGSPGAPLLISSSYWRGQRTITQLPPNPNTTGPVLPGTSTTRFLLITPPARPSASAAKAPCPGAPHYRRSTSIWSSASLACCRA
jgi:hypothetical protein